jgi:hypothetical protein
MMKASALSFQAAVLFVIAGMIWGITMAISDDHSAMPAHAHLNLLGWVSLFLFGIYYKLHPSLEDAKSAMAQVWIWIIGTIVLAVGVALVHTGHAVGDPIAAVGSFIVLLDMLLFGWLVYRGERVNTSAKLASATR